MAAVNFPDPVALNPATGEQYGNGWYNDPDNGGNGVTYQYTNGVWRAVTSPSDALDDRYVEVAGDTMTGALSINDEIILKPDGSAEFAGDVQMASQNSGPLAGFRNQIINGDFRIWQRSDSQAEVGFASVDRWRSNSSRQLNYSDQVKPPEFVRAIRGAVANEVLSLRHPIELFSDTGVTSSAPFYDGSEWTLSWWAKCDDNTPGSVNAKLTWSSDSATLGTAASQVVDVPFDGDWKQYSTTFTIQGQASNTDKCLLVSIAVTPSSTGKAVLTGVQLEPGPVATPFEHRPIGTELALCQRYYQPLGTAVIQYANANGSNTRLFMCPRQMTSMRGGVTLSPPASVLLTNDSDTNSISRTYNIASAEVAADGVVIIETPRSPSNSAGAVPDATSTWKTNASWAADAEL